MLSEVLSRKTCAKCKICCTFDYSDQWETPLFDEKIAKKLENEGIKCKNVNGLYTFDMDFQDNGEILLCPVLDNEKGCQLQANEKPYDCKIWPLRPMKKDGKVVVTLSPVCPNFVANDGEIIKLVNNGLGEEILNEARKNPLIVKDYIQGYKVVFE